MLGTYFPKWGPFFLPMGIQVFVGVGVRLKNSHCTHLVQQLETNTGGIPETHSTILMPEQSKYGKLTTLKYQVLNVHRMWSSDRYMDLLEEINLSVVQPILGQTSVVGNGQEKNAYLLYAVFQLYSLYAAVYAVHALANQQQGTRREQGRMDCPAGFFVNGLPITHVAPTHLWISLHIISTGWFLSSMDSFLFKNDNQKLLHKMDLNVRRYTIYKWELDAESIKVTLFCYYLLRSL